MKNFKFSIAYLAIFSMIFTSCSKEEATTMNDPDNMATLSFGTMLNDLTNNRSATKAHLGFLDDVPECLDGTADYVEIILSRDGENIVWNDGTERLRIELADGQMFTEEDSELELEEGNYTLEYFAVHTSNGTRLWLAPYASGDDGMLSNFVDNPLPLLIDLRAGVKKYVEVDVLCYDDRMVNEYGYLFFDIDENEAIKFCIFGNYCDEDGRHYPASYSVNVWSGDSSSGMVLYTDVYNVTDTYDNGDAYAEPVCFALPDTEGEDEYYFEITLRNSDAYGDVTEEVIRSGVITDGDVRELNDQDGDDDTTNYYHFREGDCNTGDSPDLFEEGPGEGNGGNGETPDDTDADGDGVPDSVDMCENTPAGTTVDAVGCPVDGGEPDCGKAFLDDSNSYKEITATDLLFPIGLFLQEETLDLSVSDPLFADASLSFTDDGDVVIQINVTEGSDYWITGLAISVSTEADGDPNVTYTATQSELPVESGSLLTVTIDVNDLDDFVVEDFYLRIDADVCASEM